MVFPLFDALQVQYDATLRLMRFQWREAQPHPLRTTLSPRRDLRPALLHGRRLMRTYQPTGVLVDLEGLPAISLQDELWMSVHWLPEVLAKPLQYVALVMRHEHLHNQMVIETLISAAHLLFDFQLQVFEEIPAALDWLAKGDAAAVQRLQADWEAGPAAAPDAALPT